MQAQSRRPDRHPIPGANSATIAGVDALRFLRAVFAVDAVSCAAMGALLLVATDALVPLLGLPEGLLRAAAFVLLPFAALVGWVASRARPPRALGWIIVVVNGLWVIDSALVAFGGRYGITAIGIGFVLAQAAAVAALAALEALGLRRTAPGALAAAASG